MDCLYNLQIYVIDKLYFPYFCSVEDLMLAVRENANGPRREVILHIKIGYICRRGGIIVGKKCSTGPRI